MPEKELVEVAVEAGEEIVKAGFPKKPLIIAGAAIGVGVIGYFTYKGITRLIDRKREAAEAVEEEPETSAENTNEEV